MLLTLSLAIYFLPALLASGRHHSRAGTIGLVNVFAGWTVIGWLVCLVWALSEAPLPRLPYPAADVGQYGTPAYPAGWSAAAAAGPQQSCRACYRPVPVDAAFCPMCGALLR